MPKIVIDLSMSLDGFIAGPSDSADQPLGLRGGDRLHAWYFDGSTSIKDSDFFKPKGKNIAVVHEMFASVGAMLTGRRLYDIVGGWGGSHPIPGLPIIVLTHHVPTKVPKGTSEFFFVTDGIESAVEKAKAAAGKKDVSIGGASAAQQALKAGLVDELNIHVAPILLGAGVRLFEHLGSESVALERIDVIDAPEVTHLRYRVARS
jgi:dihydrofolate reductase